MASEMVSGLGAAEADSQLPGEERLNASIGDHAKYDKDALHVGGIFDKIGGVEAAATKADHRDDLPTCHPKWTSNR